MEKLLYWVTLISRSISYFLFFLYAKRQWKKGRGMRFTNVTFLNGQKMSENDYIYLTMTGHTLLMKSAQGNLIFVHGNPDGKISHGGKQYQPTDTRFLNDIPEGYYYGISCYAGTKLPVDRSGKVIDWVFPDTPYPVHSVYMGGNLYVCESTRYLCEKVLMVPIATESQLVNK